MTKLSEVESQRLDSYYHLPFFETKYKAMQKSPYSQCKFGKLIVDLKNGVEIRDYVNEGVRYLRVSDMSRNGIVCSNQKFIVHQKIPEKIQLNKNCVLISRSGSLGLINTVDSEIEKCILSSHIFKVEIDSKKILPAYLEVFLRSQLGQFQFFRKNNGGVIPEINQEALKSIQITLPPIVKQTEIANHIRVIRNQAQALKVEADKILDNAKKNVEKMILGE